MSTDNLDQLPDRELDKLFAVEVTGWFFKDFAASGSFGGGRIWHDNLDRTVSAPSFTTDANAVLPWLAKHTNVVAVWADGSWSVDINEERYDGDDFSVYTIATADAPSFAVAAVTALLRAARARK